MGSKYLFVSHPSNSKHCLCRRPLNKVCSCFIQILFCKSLTGLDLVFQRLPAVVQQLAERLRLLLELEVEELPQLDRVVEVEHLLVAVVGLGDEVLERVFLAWSSSPLSSSWC